MLDLGLELFQIKEEDDRMPSTNAAEKQNEFATFSIAFPCNSGQILQ